MHVIKTLPDSVYHRSPDGLGQAIFSQDGEHRYILARLFKPKVAAKDMLAFVGLNPSKAGATQNDATIRRCIGFAKLWGYQGFYMLNLFSFIATKPRDLQRADDPTHEVNWDYLNTFTSDQHVERTVCCWGGNADAMEDIWITEAWQRIHRPTYCFGYTNSRQPLHPLRLPKTIQLQTFNRLAPRYD